MKRLVFLGALLGVCGCADTHLGDFYGRRTKAAFDAQAQAGGGDSAGTMDAEDAKLTLARQRGRGLPGNFGVSQQAPSSAAYGSGSSNLGSGSGGAVSGGSTSGGVPLSTPGGTIRLDAVR